MLRLRSFHIDQEGKLDMNLDIKDGRSSNTIAHISMGCRDS